MTIRSNTQSSYQGQHVSVMLDQSIDYLNCSAGAHFLDFTFGGGGHSEAILKKTEPNGTVDGFDRDAQVLTRYTNKELLNRRLFLHHKKMSEVPAWLDKHQRWQHYDGAILDCGVSSFQLDHAERGFSYMHEGPLDMRMNDQSGLTAKELILQSSEQNLQTIIKHYGEENFSGRIARVIKEKQTQLHTTQDLVNCIVAAIPNFVKGKKKQAVLSRVFQGIRIAVNDEMKEIEFLLNQLCEQLKPLARIVVISFHSIEDRVVKTVFRAKEQQGFVTRINKKVILPGASELEFNSRSRSAKMRVVECLERSAN